MFKAMVVKELRENAWIALVATGMYLWMLSGLTQTGPLAKVNFLFVIGFSKGVPFVDSQFSSFFALIAGVMALALGYRQSVAEAVTGTYLTLLHRPWSRRNFFLTKLAVGVALILVTGILPIWLYGLWASRPGNVPAPFEWSMSHGTTMSLLVILLLYFGAFLSGLRTARWFGTRLLPLVASMSALSMFFPLFLYGYWGLCVIYLAAVYLLFIGAICIVANTRDYS
jgi:hypothetical protein